MRSLPDARSPQRFWGLAKAVSRPMETTPSPTAASGGPHRSGVLSRFVHAAARSAARRPKTTVALWLALIVACVVLGSSAGMRTLSNAGSGTGESARADARLTASGLQGPATENVLVRSSSPERTAHAVNALEAGARRLPAVKSVQGPGDSSELSRAGGRTALVVVTLRGDPKSPDARAAQVEHFVDQLSANEHGVKFYEAGAGSEDNAITQLVNNGLHRAELISVPITLVILVLAFGALVAASVPLLLGLTSVGAAIGALGLVSHIAPNGSSTAPVVVLIGLAVGVDYSLFYIRRERVERRNGATADAALAATSATVGRAILVAGMTVVIGLAGLLFTGFGVFTSMALGAILVVLIAVVGSLTVLPAMLALLGDRIDRGRIWPRRRRTRSRRRRTHVAGLAAGVTNRPRTSLALAVVILGALAAPLLSITDRRARTERRVAEHADPCRVHGDRAGLPGIRRHGRSRRERTRTAQPASDLGAAQDRPSRRQQITGGRGAVAMQVSRDGQTALLQIPMPDSSIGIADNKVRTLQERARAGGRKCDPRSACGSDRRLRGQPRFHESPVACHPAGDRVRARAGVHPADRDVPFLAAGPVGHRAQPAFGRCRVRRAGRGVPASLGTVAARLPVRRPGRRLAPAVRVRGAVRPVDGLHRAGARACSGGAPTGRERETGRGHGARLDRRDRHQRRARDDRRVLRVRHAPAARVQAARGRAGGGDRARRDDRSRSGAAGGAHVAGRPRSGPAPGRPSRRRARGWDHEVNVAAIGSSHD